MKETKRKWFIILIAILIIGVVGLGLTYAYWTLSFTQENSNFVTSDCFHITFDGKNDINLQKAYPMSDDELYDFYESATPYHFVIENTCDAEATAIINLETIARDNKLADEYIETILYNGEKTYSEIIKNSTESEDVYSRKKLKRKYTGTNGEINFYNYQLTNNPINQNKVINNSLTAYKLYEFKFKGKGKREFNLLQYMYQETPANENTINKTFESKITVTTAYKPTIPTNALAVRNCSSASDCTDETRVFQTDYIENATKIVFQNKMEAPTEYEASFDESEGKDGSVKAYVVRNDDATYTIYFQTNGNFKLTSGYCYFQGFSKVEEIEGLKYVDTGLVTNMGSMFYGMNALTSLDLSHFDTSKVTNMGGMFAYMMIQKLDLSQLDTSKVNDMHSMFAGMSSLTNLDVSHFDTHQVTNMSGMFAGVSSLVSLDLSSLDTSNVTNMNAMFSDMSNLTSLDLSSFDTSNVTNMNSMFRKMHSLTSLNLSTFDTNNVTDMIRMFNEMRSLTTLDLSNFDTHQVTNMNGMFQGMSSLTSLDISSFDTSNVTVMGGAQNYHGMFADSPNLSTITYGEKFIRKEGSEIGNMFYNCPANKPTHESWDGAFAS